MCQKEPSPLAHYKNVLTIVETNSIFKRIFQLFRKNYYYKISKGEHYMSRLTYGIRYNVKPSEHIYNWHRFIFVYLFSKVGIGSHHRVFLLDKGLFSKKKPLISQG